MTYTDNQLKQALAKMLPEQLFIHKDCELSWKANSKKYQHFDQAVLDTELLHICWLIEQTLEAIPYNKTAANKYSDLLTSLIQDAGEQSRIEARYKSCSASWQQRTIALAKVKGMEI